MNALIFNAMNDILKKTYGLAIGSLLMPHVFIYFFFFLLFCPYPGSLCCVCLFSFLLFCQTSHIEISSIFVSVAQFSTSSGLLFFFMPRIVFDGTLQIVYSVLTNEYIFIDSMRTCFVYLNCC